MTVQLYENGWLRANPNALMVFDTHLRATDIALTLGLRSPLTARRTSVQNAGAITTLLVAAKLLSVTDVAIST